MQITVTPVAPDGLSAACRVLTAHLWGLERDLLAQRYRDIFTSRQLDPAGLFVAQDKSGVVLGAMIVQSLTGALGLAWPPRAEQGRNRLAVETALVTGCCHLLRERGVKICQSFAPAAEREEMVSLVQHQFQRVTEVVHLHRQTPSGTNVSPVTQPFTFHPFVPDDRKVFTTTLLATYRSSLDCPELTGDRTPEELLEGFVNPHAKSTPCWNLVHHAGQPIGVVLLDAGAEPGTWELNYLGLVPTARGRGWGDLLVRFAVGQSAKAGATRLTLSVDARNRPALRLYERHGFQEYDRRDVYLASWPKT
jgi:GNAT superfamily N-acetyltransferase